MLKALNAAINNAALMCRQPFESATLPPFHGDVQYADINEDTGRRYHSGATCQFYAGLDDE